jgi:septum formation protein
MILSKQLTDYRIVLASQSPRRKTLLEGLDIDFEIIVRPDIEEEFPASMELNEVPSFLAFHKSNNYIDLLDERTIVITADTVVILNNNILGKPVDEKDAKDIISQLSGKMHEVVTGVCIRSKNKIKEFSVVSKVWFRKLSEEEIDYYVTNYKPMDKAGAYGIQEWIGYAGIERIEGSFYNVMGLPVMTLYCELIDFIKSN